MFRRRKLTRNYGTRDLQGLLAEATKRSEALKEEIRENPAVNEEEPTSEEEGDRDIPQAHPE